MIDDTPAPKSSSAGALMLVAVALVAANLRMTITAVGPLLEQIGADEGISPAALGMLGALPLVFWGLVSPASHWLSARLGMSTAVSWALVVFAGGTLWRSLPGNDVNLWVGTALIGCGLAVANVLMPAIIKRDFPGRVPLLMGLYTALLSGMAALGAGVAVPLSELPLAGGDPAGWRFALVAMGAPIPIALGVWIAAGRRRARVGAAGDRRGVHAPIGTAGRRVWGDPLAWQVSLYMGAQSAIFYTLASWFAPYQISNGLPAATAGAELMVFQAIGLAGSLGLPFVARNARVRRWMPALLPAAGLVAWVGIPLAPQAMPAWILIGGLVGGASLTVSLTLMAERARTSEQATALSGMAQALGYLIAAAGPLLFGVLLGATGGWVPPFALIWVAAATQLVLGLSVGRARFILER